MPTRPELRVAVRRRLNDVAYDPVHDHATVDRAIAEAIRRYSSHVPAQCAWRPVVSVGARELVLPDHLDGRKITDVVDDQGYAWERWVRAGDPPPLPYGEPVTGYTWRVWSDALLLGMPAPRTGLWTVTSVTPRAIPTDDTTPLDIAEGDEALVVAQAAAILLHREAIALGRTGFRRSSQDPRNAAARACQIDADRLLWLRIERDAGWVPATQGHAVFEGD